MGHETVAQPNVVVKLVDSVIATGAEDFRGMGTRQESRQGLRVDMTWPHPGEIPLPVEGPRARRAFVVGLLPIFALFGLAGANVSGQAGLWENAHWTLSSIFAAIVATLGIQSSAGRTRQLRTVATMGLVSSAIGAITWDLQVAAGAFLVPAPSDIFFLGMAAPISWALMLRARDAVSRGELIALALDGATLLLAITTAVLFVFAPIAQGVAPGLGVVLLAYPIVYLGLAGFVLVTALATGERHSLYLVAAGLGLTGITWALWIQSALVSVPAPGNPLNMVSSVATIMVGAGVATWRPMAARETRWGRIASTAIPMLAVITAAAFLITARGEGRTGSPLVDVAAWSVIGCAVIRQTLLLFERSRFLAAERAAADRERELRSAAQDALEAQTASEKRYREVMTAFGHLGEQLTYVDDETQMLTAAAAAINELCPVSHGEIQVVDPSSKGLTVGFGWGLRDGWERERGTLIQPDTALGCIGIQRSSPNLVRDVRDPFAVACPAYPATGGSVLCLPLIASGQAIGVIHLGRVGDEFGNDDRVQAARVAEQVALAIANVRLMRSMQDLALTDPLTGLYNSRFFDPYLERELAYAAREGSPLGIVMIDLDHFKLFNDTYGHQAGDEALRTFARSATKVIRQSDTLARCGGEEFVLLVRDAGLDDTAAVAEKIRAALDVAVVNLADGSAGRITASFGVASSREHGTDPLELVRRADQAMYQAKRAGRNRVAKADRPG